MSKPTQTRKPCPGCGNSWQRDVEDFLCRSCKGRIADAIKAEEVAKKKGDDLGDAGFMALAVPDPESDKACGFEILPQGVDYRLAEATELVRALCRMVMEILPDAEALPRVPDRYTGTYRTINQSDALPLLNRRINEWPIKYKLGTEQQRRAILKFFDTLRPLMLAIHQHGIDHGRNLLAQLASGEITLNSLNDATTHGR